MKRFYKFLMSAAIMMALTVPWTVQAQEDACDPDSRITLANADAATTTTSYIPGYSFYNYAFSEVIVLAENLEGMGDIYSMQFKPAAITAGDYFNNCEIYLAHTTLSDLSDGWIQDSTLKLVYTGSLNYSSTDWRTVVFDSVFHYNGNSNLVVAVRRNHGDYTSGSTFSAYTAGAQLARYVYQDSGPYTIGSLPAGTLTNTVPLYRFTGCPVPVTCARVSEYAISDLEARSFVLSWNDLLNSGASYAIMNLADSSVVANGIADTFYQVENLRPETSYTFALYAECGDDNSRHTIFNVTTPPACAVITHLDVVATTAAALISWTPSVTDPECQGLVQYKIASDSTADWSEIAVTNNAFYTLYNLTPGTTYDVRVAALCDNGDTSRWISTSFSTASFVCTQLDTTSMTYDTIGTGTTTNSNIPGNSFYNYSYSQQIFTAAEIGHAGSILSLSVMPAAVTSQRTYEVYLGHVNVETATSWLNPTDLTLVYAGGNIQMTANQWLTFELETPFPYNGSDNLLVVFRDMTGSYVSGTTFKGTNGASGCSRYDYRDASPYTPGNPGVTGNTGSFRNNIIIKMGECLSQASCASPAATVSNIGNTEVTLSWVPGADESSWNLEYRMVEDSTWTTAASSVMEYTYTFAELSPNTEYVFRVVNACADSDYVAVVTARTTCPAYTLPFAENFDSYGTGSTAAFNSCWYMNNTYSITNSYVTNSYAHSGSNSMYGYHTTGTENWLVLPDFSLPAHDLEMSFWEYITSTGYGTVEVGVITDPTDLTTFTTVATFAPSTTGMWHQFSLNFQDYNGPDGRIAIVSRGNYSACYIDDIEVLRYSTCPRPNDVTALHVTHNSAQISWVAPDAEEHSYVVLWSTVNDLATAVDSTEVTSGTICNITELADSTTYYVWVYNVCDEDVSGTVMTSFMTAPSCGKVENLTVSNVTYTTATASWEAPLLGNDPSGYTVTVTNLDTTVADFTTTTPNTFVFLTGLDTATNYMVTVTTNCDATASNAVSISFSTPVPGIIGGNDNTGYTPTYPYYNYSISEMLWTAGELVGYGNAIDSIAFNASGTISGRRMQIYIGNTTLENLSTTSYVSSANMTLVFDSIYNIATGLNWFPFRSSFVRNADQNLVIMVVDSTGSYESFSGWVCGTSAINSLYSYQDDNPYSTTDLSSLNTAAYRPQIMLGAEMLQVTCYAPALVVSGSDLDAVSITWSGSHDSYDIDYRLASDSIWTNAATGLTGVNSYTIAGLAASTQYLVRVTGYCGTTSVNTAIFASTLCGDINVPYTENFDDYSNSYFARPCWTIGTANNTISETTYPYVSNLIGQGPALRLYQGAYVVLPHIADALNTLQLRFEFISSNTIYPMLFGYMTDPENLQTFVVIDTLHTNDPEAEVRNYTIRLDMLDDDVDAYLAFYTPIQNPQNYTFIDNLIVEAIPSCEIPDSLTVTGVTTTTADLAWTIGEGMTPEAYKVLYRQYGTTTFDTATASTNEITLTGLAHSTTYEAAVYAICSATEESAVSPLVRFVTGCAPMSLPYSENFDNYPVPAAYYTGVMPNCWTTITESQISGNQLPQIYYGNAQSGSYSLSMYGFATVALPEMDTTIDALQLSFHAYTGSTDYGLVVGVLDSLTPNSEFHPVDTILVPTYGSYDYNMYMAAAGVQHGYIAFKNFNTGSSTYSYQYIDNVVVSLAPTCLPVNNVTAILDSASSITLDWTDPRPATEWEISYSTTALADPSLGTVVPVTAHPFMIDNLSDTSNYYFYIRTICGAGDSAEWVAAGPYRCNVHIMRANQTDTLYICGGTIYDDGGPDGTYSSSQTSTIILMPSDGSSLVSVSGYSNTESSWDYLTIYDGAGTSGAVLFCDNSTPNGRTIPELVSSTGPLTLVLESDGTVNYDGFEIHVGCYSDVCPISDVAVDTVNPMTTNSATIIWNSEATNFQVAYGPAGFNVDSATLATTTTTSYVLNDLEALHNYDFYVRALCNESNIGLWHMISFSTPLCDNATVVENFDTSMTQGTSSYGPIGYSLYNYSYAQTLIDASRMASEGLTGDITAFAFNAASVTAGSAEFENMTVYMANVSDSSLDDSWILPDSNHVFVKVIDSANFNFSETGWQIHGFTTPFTWDGQSNVLFAVVRDNGSWASGPNFVSHNDSTRSMFRYAYRDSDPYNYLNPDVEGTALYNVGDIRFFSCGASCSMPTIVNVADTIGSITVTWANSANTELAIMEGEWDETMVDMSNLIVTTATTYTFDELADSTLYSIGLRQICEDSLYSNWRVVTVITPARPCYEPTNVNVSDISFTSAVIDWTPGRNETAWQLHITGPNYDDTIEVNEHPYTLTNLYSNTTYTYEVRAICSEENASDWTAATAPFTTLTCVTPDQPTVSNITPYGATISWTASENASGNYQIEYGIEDFNQGYGTLVSVNGAVTFNITGLTANRNYDVYVRSICATGVNSDWSTKATFHTPNADSSVTYYTVTANVNDPTMGTVNGAGQYQENATATLTAVANDGYHFVNWNTGDTTATISFTVTGDVTYTAYFEANPVPQYTITVVANDSTMGTVTGSGTYDEGTVITLGATANIGYHFDHWSTGETTASINVTVTEDATYTAYFAENDTSLTYYMVTANVNDSTMGYVNGAGQYEEGTIATLTAVANNGYRFLNWSNGETTATITFSVTEDVTLTAYFEAIPTYTLTVNVNNAAMGRVNGIPEGPVVEGTQVTLTAVANTGYQFDNWSTGETTATITVTVNSDMTITANFSTVGIDDVATTAINMYPNPATNFVTLTGIEGTATVTVVDMNGRENGKWTVTNGELTIDVTDLAQGAYFVRIMGEQVNAIRKLIVR